MPGESCPVFFSEGLQPRKYIIPSYWLLYRCCVSPALPQFSPRSFCKLCHNAHANMDRGRGDKCHISDERMISKIKRRKRNIYFYRDVVSLILYVFRCTCLPLLSIEFIASRDSLCDTLLFETGFIKGESNVCLEYNFFFSFYLL